MKPEIRQAGAILIALAVIALLAALLAAVALAAAPGVGTPVAVIAGPNTGSPVRPILLDGRGSNGTAFTWLASPADSGRGLVAFDGGKRAAFSAAIPGKYMVLLVVDQTAYTGHAIVISEDPQPNPFPDPIPPPLKVASVVVVEETAQRTPEQFAVMSAPPWRTYLADSGIKLRFADQDVTDETGALPADLKPAIERAKQDGLPRVVFLDAGGSVVASEALPNSGAEMLKLVTVYGGM